MPASFSLNHFSRSRCALCYDHNAVNLHRIDHSETYLLAFLDVLRDDIKRRFDLYGDSVRNLNFDASFSSGLSIILRALRSHDHNKYDRVRHAFLFELLQCGWRRHEIADGRFYLRDDG